MIRPCSEDDLHDMLSVINDAARAYRGHIPADCCHEPYMSIEELGTEITRGVRFWGYLESGVLRGVMGIQDMRDVTLIRHAYVSTDRRGSGIGSSLLEFLMTQTEKPLLMGTWAAAVWAIRFYEKHGYRLVTKEEKDRLLKTYWTIPDRQIETSVVLADERYFTAMRGE